MTRPLLQTRTTFAPSTVEKAERLLEVLAALREDPVLGSAFVLHGGTALNFFHEPLPRLSVDIDLMYVEKLDVSAMRRRRPEIDGRCREVIGALGYAVQATNDEHSGQTYRLKYSGDYIKLDISYLARLTMLDAPVLACPIAEPEITFPVQRVPELAAGKIKAIIERTAARDLYDLHRMSKRYPRMFDAPLSRALTIRAISTADPFPSVRDPAEALGKFKNPTDDLAESLHAVLAVDDQPEFEPMIGDVGGWLSPLGQPAENEEAYFRLLDEESEYRPDLLLEAWPEVLERAREDPVVAWKVHNLRKRGK